MAKKTVYRFKNIYDHIKAVSYTHTVADVFYLITGDKEAE